MKTQVLQLELQDDATSVRDKIAWTKADRILLVFPARLRTISRTLELRLIQRHVIRLGVQLAIVSRSEGLRQIAAELGISAFKTTEEAQYQAWQDKPPAGIKLHSLTRRQNLRRLRKQIARQEAKWRSLFWIRFPFFSLAVLALLAVMSFFIPSATIQLNPATRQQRLSIPVEAGPGTSAVNLAGSIPARLESIAVEQSKTIPVTGSTSIPAERANGTVVFRNLTDALVGIPAGTVVSSAETPAVRFATTSDVVISAGVHATVAASVQAVDAGSAGNLPAETLIAIAGDLGTSLAVTNPQPTAGGTDRTAAIQTAADRELVRSTLEDQILETCATGIQEALLTGDLYFPDTLQAAQVLSEVYFPAENQSSDTLTLTLRLQCQAYYASQEDLALLATQALDANLPDGFTPVPSEVSVTPINDPVTTADGITRWDEELQRLLIARLDPRSVIKYCAWQKPEEAILRLNNLMPLAESPVIQINPAWWPRLPVFPFRITVSLGG